MNTNCCQHGNGGLSGNTTFYNVTTTLAMVPGRFGLAIPALAFVRLFARQRKSPVTMRTLPTDSSPFGIFLIVWLVIITALSYLLD